MKKIILAVLIAVMWLTNGFAQQKDLLKEAKKFYSEKNYTQAIQTVDKAIKQSGETDQLIEIKYYSIVALERYEEALVMIDSFLEKRGVNDGVLSEKFKLLLKMEKYQDALEVIKQREKTGKTKLYKPCLDGVTMYIKMKNKDKAFEWLEKAVDKGYMYFPSLYQDKYKFLQKNDGAR